MFFEKINDINRIALKVSCSVFVVPPNTKLKLPHALYLRPNDDKKTELIGVDDLREFLSFANQRESTDQFYIITPADAMNEPAQNAFLKTFEEPSEHHHFVLLTEHPSSLLPTILSRAQVFQLKQANSLDQPPTAKDKILAEAKKLIAATPRNLSAIAIEMTKSKTKPRQQALEVVGTAVELLYKSYFKTSNDKFLAKLPNFIQLYENLQNNGHIKLHLVADLLS